MPRYHSINMQELTLENKLYKTEKTALSDIERAMESSQQLIVHLLTLVGVLFLLFFIVFSFWGKDYIIVVTHSGALIVAVVNWLIFLKLKNTVSAANILVFAGIPAIVPFLVTGGPENIGYVWTAPYIIYAFFLAGTHRALFWLSIYFLLSLITIIFSIFGTLTIAYTVPVLVQLSFLFLVTGFLVYFFDRTRQKYQRILALQTHKVLTSNKMLAEEAHMRVLTEQNVKNKNNELETINKHMVERELQMIELKKEIEKLKNEA